MAQKVITHLMFEGAAEQAMALYVSLFPDSEMLFFEKYGKDGPGAEGTIMVAQFTIAGRHFQCADSPMKHDFDFTPSMSIFVDCESEDELTTTFGKLSEGGNVLMPLDSYGFSTRFGWVNDRFGVSWQLNLP